MTPGPDAALSAAATTLAPAPSTSRHVEAAGLRLHYLDYGTAGHTPMLCLHGGAAHAHWYDFVAGAFTADHHVLALDQRGHGDSAWPDPPDYTYPRFAADLAEVVERLDLRDFVLVGHSMGGMISLAYAATHPGRVSRLIVVDTTMYMGEGRIGAMRDRGKRPGRTFATHDEYIAGYRLLPESVTTAPEIVRYIARDAGRQLPDGSWGHKFDRNVFATRADSNGLPYWSEIRIPALLVKGGRSHRITPQIVAEVRERCPQVELAEVPRSDHHVTLDNPSGFVKAVRDFLARRA